MYRTIPVDEMTSARYAQISVVQKHLRVQSGGGALRSTDQISFRNCKIRVIHAGQNNNTIKKNVFLNLSHNKKYHLLLHQYQLYFFSVKNENLTNLNSNIYENNSILEDQSHLDCIRKKIYSSFLFSAWTNKIDWSLAHDER